MILMLDAIFGIEDVSTLDICKYQIIVDLVISSRFRHAVFENSVDYRLWILEIHRIF